MRHSTLPRCAQRALRVAAMVAAAAATALPTALVATAAQAQAWPAKPIVLVSPWPPGGPADAIARPVMERLSQALGQPIVIDSKAGANGMIGTQFVAKAAPDGYTLLLSHAGPTAITPTMQRDLGYQPIKDFEHITIVASPTIVLIARPELPFKTVPELIAYAKENPGKLAYGSVGPGSTTHLAGEMLASMANVQLLHVPYKGAAPVITDMLGGRIQIAFIGNIAAMSHVKAGTLRLLATASSPNRPAVAPDVPTMHETLPGFEVNSWYGLAAPAGTPKAIVDRIYTEIAKILAEPDIIAKLRASGSEPGGMPPADFVAKIQADTARWAKVTEAAGLKQ